MVAEIINIGGEDQPVGGDQTSQGTEVGMWKCQVDASWIEDQGDTGLGFVLLDDERTILFGFKGNISSASPLHAEAEGIIWAMQEILKSGGREIQILSDSLALELDEIKALSSDFSSFSISAIPRSQNARADRLAKGGRLRKLNPSVSAFAPIWLAPEASLTAAE
ncbi:PREDICTED: uncharacterized protein LOC106303041 [Brassica oleracea var. oleracea]|uniref:uncharacterized protein LOC106303041 n=1 Tax=Brassica oleracea var. oleracea TaxID=109376 RepID=UPI0006A74830|nr:PREDICTED: uncharacterized protein LOC106303041 [Brassica oleracea var. oleracea]